MMVLKMPEWIRIDEREDAINALEHAAASAETLEADPANWKWLIVSLHNALQGTLVCTLSGTAGVGALDEKSMKKVMEWFEISRDDPDAPMPRERMADPISLFERAMIPDFMSEFGGSPLKVTQEQQGDVKLLNQLRRKFAHLLPVGWSIESAGLPRIVLNVTAIIETLLLSHPANTFRLEQKQTARVREAVGKLREVFS